MDGALLRVTGAWLWGERGSRLCRFSHADTLLPGINSQVPDSSERAVWASKVKGQSSSADKTMKHEAESYSQPRTLLQRQDKRLYPLCL